MHETVRVDQGYGMGVPSFFATESRAVVRE